MKGAAFQLIASGVALGVMGGAVAIHWLHLAGARNLSSRAARGIPLVEREIAGVSFSSGRTGARDEAGAEGSNTKFASEEEARLALLQEMISRMEDLKEFQGDIKQQQEQLEAQQAETNRDLNILELRVDSHSMSFRPLPSSDLGGIRERSISPGARLLSRPISREEHPLLPPKDP